MADIDISGRMFNFAALIHCTVSLTSMAFSINNKKALTARYEKMYFSTKDRLISFVQYHVRDRAVADDIVQVLLYPLMGKHGQGA